jgi:hypothetical protein
MMKIIGGTKAKIIIAVIVIIIILILFGLIRLFIYLFPIIVIIILLSYLFKMLNKFKKGSKKHNTFTFKIRKK